MEERSLSKGQGRCCTGRRFVSQRSKNARPLQLVCSLELKVAESVVEQKQNETVSKNQRVQRNAAKEAEQRIRFRRTKRTIEL